MIFKIIGGLLVLWGAADFITGLMKYDLWYNLFGIQLQGLVYQFSAWAAIIGGGVIWGLGSKGEENTDEVN